MKKFVYLLSTICLATLPSLSAHADPINLASYVGKTISMTVQPYVSGENNGSFYVGLTQVNFSQHDLPLDLSRHFVMTSITRSLPLLHTT